MTILTTLFTLSCRDRAPSQPHARRSPGATPPHEHSSHTLHRPGQEGSLGRGHTFTTHHCTYCQHELDHGSWSARDECDSNPGVCRVCCDHHHLYCTDACTDVLHQIRIDDHHDRLFDAAQEDAA